MRKFTFRFETPLELSSYEELMEKFDSLPRGLVPSFVSPDECSVFSDLEPLEVERKMGRLLLEYTDPRNVLSVN